MDVLSVVQHLRELAADPRNRSTIAKDQSSLQSLVLFLDNDDEKVVNTALEALYLLAKTPTNHNAMKTELGMVISLQTIMKSEKSAKRTRDLASAVHTKLCPSDGAIASSIKKVKQYVLQVKGLMDETCRRIAEEKLLSVSGVISFTFNMAKKRCTVRAKKEVKPSALCEAISSSKIMHAEQVIRKQTGEEMTLSYDSRPNQFESEPKNDPEYLPEPDLADMEENKTALARPEKESSANKSSSWFGTVSGYLAKSLYW
ncbi:armadillo repeat-containing protein 1-like [Oscarella lobularis]|uniref:armadillo repeat-containing protein 1-like n=1 Tax=Oscarella lobularis TaxID=121494 RepID=UPI003313867C